MMVLTMMGMMITGYRMKSMLMRIMAALMIIMTVMCMLMMLTMAARMQIRSRC